MGDDTRLREAREAEARGFLEKNVEDMELTTTIRRVATGKMVSRWALLKNLVVGPDPTTS
jgi:DNA-binding NarL/FixJ family response regulator